MVGIKIDLDQKGSNMVILIILLILSVGLNFFLAAGIIEKRKKIERMENAWVQDALERNN